MNVILPRYAGAIAESVVNEPVDVDVDDVSASAAATSPSINAAATKSDGLGCHAGAKEL
jgi:chlorophyllide a reductase subunit Y